METTDTTTMSLFDQAKFYLKCKNDPIFFIENCIRLPHPKGFAFIKMYVPQYNIVNTFMKDHFLIMLKSRQTGGSTITQALLAYLILFYENYNVGVISRSGPESSAFVKKTLLMLDNIPQDFIRPDKSTGYIERNAQSFLLKKTNSSVIAQAVSPAQPENIFRGSSLNTIVFDEAAFIRYVDVAETAITPSLSIAQNVCKTNNIPYGNIIISTPNSTCGQGAWFYKKWIGAVTGESMYKPIKIHWRDVPSLTDEWYHQQCNLLNNDQRKIKQEMELVFVNSSDSIWDDKIQEILNKKTDECDNYQEIKMVKFENTVLKLFKPINTKKSYFIGIDCAASSGTDRSVIEVIDLDNLEQCAEIICKIEPLMFAELVKHVAGLYPKNLLIVENSGGYGLTVLQSLQFDEKKEYNIYAESRLVGEGSNKKTKWVYGINTNSKSRPLIIESMFNYVNENIHNIHSNILSAELLSLVNKNGKIQGDTAAGIHDDTVMAFAFALYVYNYQPDAWFTLKYDNKIDDLETSEYTGISLISDLYNNDMDHDFLTIEQKLLNEERIYYENKNKIIKNKNMKRDNNEEDDEDGLDDNFFANLY